MKVYIERNNIQVELICFLKNINFIDVGNFEVGNFRDRRVYEFGLVAIRDVSPLFCESGHFMVFVLCRTGHLFPYIKVGFKRNVGFLTQG